MMIEEQKILKSVSHREVEVSVDLDKAQILMRT